MPTYSEPTSYGTAEEIRFDFSDSPLADRPVLPEEMAAVVVEHLKNNFKHKDYLINPQLGYLAEDTPGQGVSILTSMENDRSEVFPKITVMPIPYKPSGNISGVHEAGIYVNAGKFSSTDSLASLMQGTCICFVHGEYREQIRSLGSELYMMLMRDRDLFQQGLHVKSFTPAIGSEEEKTDSTGRSQTPGKDFTEMINITWIAHLITQMWTERAF